MLSGSWVGSVHVGRLEELEPSAWRAPLPRLYEVGSGRAGASTAQAPSPGARAAFITPVTAWDPLGWQQHQPTWAGLGRQQLEL